MHRAEADAARASTASAADATAQAVDAARADGAGAAVACDPDGVRLSGSLPGPSPTLASSALLQLIWLASPALPVGGFSYSEGLERAIDAGHVSDEAGAAAWLVDQLHLVAARSDLPLLAAAFAAWRRGDHAEIAALNGWFASTRDSAESAQQAAQMGRSLAAWLHGLDAGAPGLDALRSLEPAPQWPVAFALCAARIESVGPRDALLACAFGWAENMVQAAVKAMPLGQAAGQRLLAALAREIPAAVEHALALAAAERQAFAPMLGVLSAQHEAQYSRLFRS
ncbi:urease accessory protein UreF [Piscinibacter koreensis]|uniref:Urease accessory protein UreF n=1 Tax=Piscinibacter koreensis TaxID=2742824 RepID=A0A7Y6TXD4_9BURK|nr:urease accessory UreF family protein [Schlegelella koreensis]NUZ06950.1 urease accessory protein UreF [Schlegelella koreensis]